MNNDKKNKNSKGFLLVEMIISVAIFTVVMTAGLGSLLSLIDANKRSQSFKIVVNNLNLAMETMAREIRTGHTYNCGSVSGGDCSGGDDIIYFTSSSGASVSYRLADGSVERGYDSGGGVISSESFKKITADDLILNNMAFYVVGSSVGDSLQPKVVISVTAYTGERVKDFAEFELQTTVSQRLLDS